MAEKEPSKKKCDICLFSSNTTTDTVLFGDWMERSNIRVHYFCLLLSTYLPQCGEHDGSGILGFLIRDIRREIEAAKKRICCYCDEPNAHIACASCCDVFHLACGRRTNCVNQFSDKFLSYCSKCLPLTQFHRIQTLQMNSTRCAICFEAMGFYNPVKFIYADCCNNGYVHRLCMQKYALDAGYYLRCLWCRSTAFRDHVRRWGVFVPDRDAQWERQKNAYDDLHRGHARCDMDPCHCPQGRNYCTNKKWQFILCALCGSVGAHNPACIPGKETAGAPIKKFKCKTCMSIEDANKNRSVLSPMVSANNHEEHLDMSVYVSKQANTVPEPSLKESSQFSDDESLTSLSSVRTVVHVPKDPAFLDEPALLAAANAADVLVTRPTAKETGLNKINLCTPPLFNNSSEEECTQLNDVRNPNKCGQLPESPGFVTKFAMDCQEPLPLTLSQLFKSQNIDETVITEVAPHFQTESMALNTFEINAGINEPDKGSMGPGNNQFENQQQAASRPTGLHNAASESILNEHVTQVFDANELFVFDRNLNCRGICTVRASKLNPRFESNPLEESQHLFTTDDIVNVTDNTGIFAEIDALIKEYT